MELDKAFDVISAAIKAHTNANGYLFCGSLHGQCEVLAERLLEFIFSDAVSQVKAKCHPDIFYLYAEGKSRTIKVDDVRSQIIAKMSTTSYSGGFKVGVIVGADRFQSAAANAILKVLEEPPPNTIFFLLTDAPDLILPTIASRTQRINLRFDAGFGNNAKFEILKSFFSGETGNKTFAKSRIAAKLVECDQEWKKGLEDADIQLMRKEFFLSLEAIAWEWIVGEKLPRYSALRNIELIEKAYRRLNNAISAELVFFDMLDLMTLP